MLQGIAHNASLKLKLRFFFKDPMEITDPVTQMLYFMQVRGAPPTPLLPTLDPLPWSVCCTGLAGTIWLRQVSASMVCDESMLPDLDAAQLAALYLQATQGDHEKKRTRALLNSYAHVRGCMRARMLLALTATSVRFWHLHRRGPGRSANTFRPSCCVSTGGHGTSACGRRCNRVKAGLDAQPATLRPLVGLAGGKRRSLASTKSYGV